MSLASKGNQMNIHECAIDYKHYTNEDGKENPDLYQNFPDDMIFYSLEKARQKSKGTLNLIIMKNT